MINFIGGFHELEIEQVARLGSCFIISAPNICFFYVINNILNRLNSTQMILLLFQ